MVRITFEADTLAGVYAQVREFLSPVTPTPTLESMLAEWDKAPSAEAVAEAEAVSPAGFPPFNVADKPKRHRRTKAEMEAARAAAELGKSKHHPEFGAEAAAKHSLQDMMAQRDRAASAAACASADAALEAETLAAMGQDEYGAPKSETIEVDPATADALVEAFCVDDQGAITDKPAPLTFDDVKQALTSILETDGLGVAKGREFLSTFNVTRLSLLDEARWPEFCAGANLLVAGAGK